MKRKLCIILAGLLINLYAMPVFAITETKTAKKPVKSAVKKKTTAKKKAAPVAKVVQPQASAQQGTLKANPNAKTIELAFVFDGPSDKNAAVLQTFQKQ